MSSKVLGARGARTGCGAGFTLLELAIVLFIMGLMLTIAVPYIGGFHGAQLKSEVRRLAGRATYLYDAAAAQKLVYRLTFDLDNNRYVVMRFDPYMPMRGFVPSRDAATAPVTMPPGVWLHDVTVEGLGTFGRGTVSTQFYPGGYVDATLVHMTDDRGTVYTLALNPLPGGVAIALGNLDLRRMSFTP